MEDKLISFAEIKASNFKDAYDKTVENMTDSIPYSSYTIAVGKIELPDSRIAEVHLTLTTDEDEFLLK